MIMRVSDLLELLGSDADVQYQGDKSVQFRGLETVLTASRQKGRFTVLFDKSWARRVRFGHQDKTIAQRVELAESKGAIGFISDIAHINEPALQGKPVFFSNNTRELATNIVRTIRAGLLDQRITAITGSAGKSTVSAMLTHSLKSLQETPILSYTSNRNLAFYLVPFVSRSHRYKHSVLEVAGSAFLAFRRWGFEISPDVAIITNISAAHSEYMGSLEDTAATKADIFNRPPAAGTAIISRDSAMAEYLVERAHHEGCQVVTYGEHPESTIRLVSYDPLTGDVTAGIGRETFAYRVGALGKHMALNSLAVIGALRAHRLARWREGVAALDTFQALSGRGEVSKAKLPAGGVAVILDETYNANPASMSASLDALVTRPNPTGGRKIAVLGDILELGNESRSIHESLAPVVTQPGIASVHLFGEAMGHLYNAAKSGASHITYWPDLAGLEAELTSLLRADDTVLFKASGSTGLREVVQRLLAQCK